MSELFLRLLNMSITAGYLVFAVLLARLFLKKSPKWISCLLWGIVALRLLLPITIESPLSLIPSAEAIPQNITTSTPRPPHGPPHHHSHDDPGCDPIRQHLGKCPFCCIGGLGDWYGWNFALRYRQLYGFAVANPRPY